MGGGHVSSLDHIYGNKLLALLLALVSSESLSHPPLPLPATPLQPTGCPHHPMLGLCHLSPEDAKGAKFSSQIWSPLNSPASQTEEQTSRDSQSLPSYGWGDKVTGER